MSIPAASGLLGDLRGVTLHFGSGMPFLLPLPAGGRDVLAGRGRGRARALDHNLRHSAPMRIRCSPWMRGGTKSPITFRLTA